MSRWPPFMIHPFCWLEQDQALAGRFHVDPCILLRSRIGQERCVIGRKVKAKKREAKAPLPLKRAVTLRRIAAQPPQQRNHVALKIGNGVGLTLFKTFSRRSGNVLSAG